MISPLKKKISRIFAIGIVKIVNNSGLTQEIQSTFLSGEVISGIRRFQEYGFASFPYTDTENVTLFFNGNRDQGVMVCVHDRDKRPTDLVEGETATYGPNDITAKQRTHYRADGSVEIHGTDINITGTGDVNVNGINVNVIAATSVNLGATGGNAVTRVGDITSTSTPGPVPHTHTLAAGSPKVFST